jgi:hypothetical protein
MSDLSSELECLATVDGVLNRLRELGWRIGPPPDDGSMFWAIVAGKAIPICCYIDEQWDCIETNEDGLRSPCTLLAWRPLDSFNKRYRLGDDGVWLEST